MFGIDIKLIIYFIVFCVLSYGAWTLYSLISDNAKKDAIIAQQTAAIVNQQKTISVLQVTEQIKNDVIKSRDKSLSDIETQLQDVTNNLGNDANDQAAASLKELFRRLK